MKQTLKQLQDETKHTEMGKILNFEVEKAKRMDGKLDFDDVEIGEIDEMGGTAGECDMRTKKMRIRKDLATTKSGIRKSIAEILIHEGEHHRGTHLEGVAELVKTVKTGKSANPHYAEEHKAAKELASEIGTQELVDASRRHGAGAEVIILSKYINKQVEKNMNPEKAKEKGKKLVKKAA